MGPIDPSHKSHNASFCNRNVHTRLTGAKPLSEPMLEYCQLGPGEQISMKF